LQDTSAREEEVKSVLHTLFVEKKRVKELQKKIQKVGDERNRLRERLDQLEKERRTPPSSERMEKMRGRGNEEILRSKYKVVEENRELQGQFEKLRNVFTEQKKQLIAAQQDIQDSQKKLALLEKNLQSERATKLKALKYIRAHRDLDEKSKKIKRLAIYLKQKNAEIEKKSAQNLAIANSKVPSKGDEDYDPLIARLKKAVKDRNTVILQHKKRFLDFENILKEKSLKNTDYAEKMDGLQGHAMSLGKENAQLKEQNKVIFERLKKTIKVLDLTKSKLASFKEAEEKSIESKSSLQGENSKLAKRLQFLRKELDKTEGSLEGTRSKFDSVYKDLEKDNEDLREQRLGLEALLAKKKEELQKALSGNEELAREKQKILKQKGSAESLLESLQSGLEAAKVEVEKVQNQLGKAKKTNVQLEDQLRSQDDESKSKWAKEAEIYRQELGALQEKLLGSNNEKRQQKKQYNNAIKTLLLLKSLLEELSEKVAVNSKDLSEVTAETFEDPAKQEAFSHVARDLTERLIASYNELRKRLQDLEARVSKRQTDKDENRCLKSEVEQLSEIKQAFEKELRKNKAQLIHMQKELQKFRGKLAEEEKQNLFKTEKIEILGKAISSHEESLEKLHGLEGVECEAKKKKEFFEKQLHILKADKEGLLKEHTDRKYLLEAKQKQYEMLLSKNTGMSKDLSDAKRELSNALKVKGSLHEDFSEIKKHNDRLKNRLENEESEKDALLEELEDLNLRYQEIKKKTHYMAENAENQGSEMYRAQQNIEELLKEQQELKNGLKKRTNSIKELEKELVLIKETLVRGVREAKEIENRYYETVEEKMAVVNRHQQVVKQLNAQSEELEVLKDQLDKIKKSEASVKTKQSELSESCKQSSEESRRLKAEVDILSVEKKQHLADKQALEAKFADVQEECSSFSMTIQDLNVKVAKLKTVEQNLRSREEEISDLKKNYQEELGSKDSQHHSMNEKLQSLLKSSDDGQRALEESQKEFSRMKEELQNQLSEALKDNESKLKQTRLDHQTELSKKQEEVQKVLESQEQDLRKTRRAYEELLSKNQEEHRVAVKDLQENASRLQERLEALNSVENEKAALSDQYFHLEEDFNELRGRFDDSLEGRQEAEKKLQLAAEQHKKLQILAKDKSDQLKVSVESEKEKQQLIDKVQQEQKEKDSQMKLLQQHFKRKMRESTSQRDLIESEKVKNLELQNLLSELRSEVTQLQNANEMQKAHERKVQAMAKESLEAIEIRSKEMEEKYFILHEDSQRDKARIRELESIKIEHDQMKGLLSNIQSFVGGAQAPQSSPLTTLVPARVIEEVPVETQAVVNQGLFEVTQSQNPSQRKQSLFE
jgi:chromosome segregation ATPase